MIWGLASLKFVGRLSGWKQTEVDLVGLEAKNLWPPGWNFRQDFCATDLKENSFSRKLGLALKAFSSLDEIHHMLEGNLYLQSTDCRY